MAARMRLVSYASSEFDFFGYSHDPAYTDDSELVVIEGEVGAGIRS